MYSFWSDPNLSRYLALGVLALLCAFFAATETSLFVLTPLDRLRLKEKNRLRGERVETLLNRPRRLLVTVLMGVETINILASVLATSLALSLWGARGKWLALGLIAPAFLLVGELIPKSLALIYASRLAPWLAWLVRPALVVFTPLRLVLMQISRGLLAAMGFRPDLQVPAMHQEDFVRMVEESHLRGLIAEMERDFIQNLLSFGELRVGQIMVPRPDIFTLPVDLDCRDLLQAIKNSRFSRVPIYRDDPDNVLGLLHAKDILGLDLKNLDEDGVLENILRPAYYVPENKKAFDLLTELQAQHLRLALVVDEYGSLVGLGERRGPAGGTLRRDSPGVSGGRAAPGGDRPGTLAGQGHHVAGGFQRGPGAGVAHGGVRHHRRPGPEPLRGSAPGRPVRDL